MGEGALADLLQKGEGGGLPASAMPIGLAEHDRIPETNRRWQANGEKVGQACQKRFPTPVPPFSIPNVIKPDRDREGGEALKWIQHSGQSFVVI